MSVKNGFHPQHYEDFLKSGLSDETITSALLRSMSPSGISRLIPNSSKVTSAYAIPYDNKGTFARFRLFYDKKAASYSPDFPKYSQPVGTPPHLYAPFYVNKEMFNDPSLPLYIVEGEKKALKGTQSGLLCIGLGGLWCYKAKGVEGLIEGFNNLNLKNREIYIVPDNDYMDESKNLRQAVRALADLLKEYTPHVRIINLPPETKGLDDYLVAMGLEGADAIKGSAAKLSALPLSSPFDLPQASSEVKKDAMRAHTTLFGDMDGADAIKGSAEKVTEDNVKTKNSSLPLKKASVYNNESKTQKNRDDETDDDPTAIDSFGYIVSTKTQQRKNCLHNAILSLSATNFDFKFNELSQTPECRGERMKEDNYYEAQTYLEVEYVKAWSRSTVTDAVNCIAGRHKYDPAKEWLEGIVWDGKERIDRAFEEDFSLPQFDYSKAVSRAFHIQVCARIMQPGCKADQALMIIGHQGIGKSRWCRALMPHEDWFADTMIHNVENKDTVMALQGCIIIEIPEMSALNKSEQEAIKGFITRQTDKYRPPYARTTDVFPRRCVIVITTNNDTPLSDYTGGRRYWIVNVGSITPDSPEDWRIMIPDRHTCDQRFAEAYIAYKECVKNDESWYYNEQEVVKMQEAATEADALVGMIEKALKKMFASEFTLADLAEGMEIRPEGLNKSLQIRMGYALKGLGYARKLVRREGSHFRMWSKKT